MVSYLGVVAATGWHAGAGALFVRCGVLSITAFLVSFLSSQLLRLIDSLQVAWHRSERSASLLSTVARSARRLTMDREQVLESLAHSVIELGFDGAAVCTFDHESELFFVVHHRGLPDRYVVGAHRARADGPGV